MAAIINFFVDPLYRFRYPSKFGNGFYNQERYLFSGLPRHYGNVELIIMGQSHSQNFHPSDAQKIFHKKTLNLAISGSTILEEATAIKMAIHHNSIKQIIWEVNVSTLRGTETGFHENAYFPKSYYKDSIISDLQYIFSLETLSLSSSFLRGRFKEQDLDNYKHWSNRFTYSAQTLKSVWCKNNIQKKTIYYNKIDAHRDLLSNRISILTALAKEYPNIQFDIFITPYSILAYNGDISKQLAMRQILLEAENRFSNIQIYDFQTWEDIITNLNNYKDFGHYSGKINYQILEEIGKRRQLLTKKNFKTNQKHFIQLAKILPFECKNMTM